MYYIYIYICVCTTADKELTFRGIFRRRDNPRMSLAPRTPNLPTKIIPTKIRRLEVSGKFHMDVRTPPLRIKILLESNPQKSRILVHMAHF